MNLRGRNQIKPEFNISSMTDVVLLFIIFFIIAYTLAKQLNTIEVKLPQADGKSENRNTAVITLTNSGQYFLNENPVSKNSLEREMIAALTNTSAPSIVLRAEKQVALDAVVYAMNIANKNGIKVVLAVETPSR